MKKIISYTTLVKAFPVWLALIAAPALAQTYTWKNVTIPAGGFVAGVEFSPVQSGLYYCRTDIGGVYRWDNTNSVWIPLTDMYSNNQYNYYGGESLAPDPVNANVVYVAAGMYTASGNGVILSSTNQGSSWTVNPIAVPMGGNNDGREAGERLAVDPNLTSTLYFGSRSNGLWKSTNFAATWAQVGAFPVNGDAGYGLSYVVFDPHGTTGSASQTIYVGVEAMASGNSNLYRSTNGGTSWSLIPGGPTNMITVHASLGTDGNLWVVYDSGGYGPNGITNGQVWKLNTATLAWTHVTLPGPGAGAGGYGGISVDAQNAQHVVVSTLDWWGGPDKIYSTTNGGTSWSVIGNAQNSWDAGPYAVYNNNGAVWTRFCGAYDGGVGWQGDVKIDPFNSGHAVYTTGGGIWDSANITAATQPGGVTWSFLDYGLEETAVLHIDAASAGGVFFSAVGDISGMRHTSLTASPTGGMYCNPTFSNTNCVDFAENNTNTVVRVGNSSTTTSDIAYSTNNGQTWAPWGSAPPGYGTANQMGSVAVAADGSHVVVAPYNGYGSPAYASSLGGAWTTSTGLPSGALLASDRVNATTIYATSGATLYESTNSGASFASVNTFTGSGEPRAVFGQAGEVWVAAGGSGLFRFTNGGSTKAQIANVSSANAVGFGMHATGQTHPAVYLVGTVSGTYGFFRCDDGVGTTWVRINDANHQFGAAGYAGGDETVYGRMFVGTNGRGILYGDTSTAATNTPTAAPSASPTNTPTRTATPTETSSMTATPTLTASSTPSLSPTFTPSSTSSLTSTSTVTNTVTRTATNSPTSSMTATPSLTASRTATFTPTATATNSPANTATATSTPTNTPTATSTNTVAVTGTSTPTTTNTATRTATSTATHTLTSTPSATPTATFSNSPTATGTNTPTNTLTATRSSTPTGTATSTLTATATLTASSTPSATPSNTFVNSPTPTNTLTATPSSTPSGTATRTATSTTTSTATSSPTSSATLTPTASSTPTGTPTNSPTQTPTATPTNTFIYSPTPTGTPTNSATSTATKTATSTATKTPTSSATATPTNSPTLTVTSTATTTPSPTPSSTPTAVTVSASQGPNPPVNSNQLPGATNVPVQQVLLTNPSASAVNMTAVTLTVSGTGSPANITGVTLYANGTALTTTTFTGAAATFNISETLPASSGVTYTVTANFGSAATGTYTFSVTGAGGNNGQAVQFSGMPVSGATVTVAQATATPSFTPLPLSTFTPSSTPSSTPSGNSVVVLYPNPVTGPAVNVLAPAYSGSQDVRVEIFTLSFRKVLDETFPKVTSGTALNVPLTDSFGHPLADGLYYVVVTVNGGHSTAKLLVLR